MSVDNDILWARDRLGYNVRLFRAQRGMSQGRLATVAKMDRAFISDVERGVVAASVEAIARLAHAFKIPAHWLLRVHYDVIPPANFSPARPPILLLMPDGERRDASAPAIGAEDIASRGLEMKDD